MNRVGVPPSPPFPAKISDMATVESKQSEQGLVLWAFPAPSYNMKNCKCFVVAAFGGLELGFKPVWTPEGVFVNHTDEYAENCHPLQRTPSLQTPEGFVFESNAIMRHLARVGNDKGLCGSTPYEQSQVDQWLDFIATEIDSAAAVFVDDALGEPFYPYVPETTAAMVAKSHEVLEGSGSPNAQSTSSASASRLQTSRSRSRSTGFSVAPRTATTRRSPASMRRCLPTTSASWPRQQSSRHWSPVARRRR